MKFYLSGGMEYKKDLGMSWRQWLTQELEQLDHKAIDPVKLEVPDEDGTPVQHKLTELKLQGNLTEVRRIVRNNLFRRDMYGIQLADAFLVFYDESVQKGAGTLSECWEAFREGKPIYIVTEFPLEKVPTWLIGESAKLFYNFEEFLAYVKDENGVILDMMNAKKIRDEVLGGLY